jgi:alcohol dehydrogenase class IV
MKQWLLAAMGISVLVHSIQAWASGTEKDISEAVRKGFAAIEDRSFLD